MIPVNRIKTYNGPFYICHKLVQILSRHKLTNITPHGSTRFGFVKAHVPPIACVSFICIYTFPWSNKRRGMRHRILGVIIAFSHTQCSRILTFFVFMSSGLQNDDLNTLIWSLVLSMNVDTFYVDKIINANIKNSWHALL